jgi:hypothetical protein
MKALALLLSLILVGVGSAQTFKPWIVLVRGALDDRTTAFPAFSLGTADDTAVGAGIAAAPSRSERAPIVTIDGGRVRGVAVPEGNVFRGTQAEAI